MADAYRKIRKPEGEPKIPDNEIRVRAPQRF